MIINHKNKGYKYYKRDIPKFFKDKGLLGHMLIDAKNNPEIEHRLMWLSEGSLTFHFCVQYNRIEKIKEKEEKDLFQSFIDYLESESRCYIDFEKVRELKAEAKSKREERKKKKEKMNKILNMEFFSKDFGGKITLKKYFVAMIEIFWNDPKDFNGKRPFGYSCRQDDLHQALIKNKFVEGKIDEEGCIDELDFKEAGKVIAEALEFWKNSLS